MEIRDYLHAIRHWLWMPIVLPLLAGAGTGLLMLKQPLQYQANATVVVPAVAAKGFSTSAAAQYVATFKDVLVSQPVMQEVSSATGVPVHDLAVGLSASTVTASSNIIHVVYTGPQKHQVAQVVRLATVDTLDAAAQPQIVQSQNSVAAAQTQLTKADDAITAFSQNNGTLFPDQDFKTKQAELSQLFLQLSQANIAGDSRRAQALQAIIGQRQQELTALAGEVSQYVALTEQRQSALTVLSHAQEVQSDAQALVAANHDPKTVTVQDIGKLSRVADVLKFSAIAAVVALILALALILLLELMRSRRVTRVVTTSDPAVAAAVAEPAAPRPGGWIRRQYGSGARRKPVPANSNGTAVHTASPEEVPETDEELAGETAGRQRQAS